MNLLKLDLRIFRRMRYALAWRTEPLVLILHQNSFFMVDFLLPLASQRRDG